MKGNTTYLQRLMLVLLAHPLAVEAHPFHWASDSLGFAGGLIHPFTGWDHMLTMLAVGLWMSQCRGRRAYLLPLAFVALMLMGCALTLVSIEIAYAEYGLVLSVLMLALLLIFANKVSMSAGSAIIAIVALFHGYVHAYDIWLDVGALAYSAGFSVATLALILAGIAARVLFNRYALKYFRWKIAGR